MQGWYGGGPRERGQNRHPSTNNALHKLERLREGGLPRLPCRFEADPDPAEIRPGDREVGGVLVPDGARRARLLQEDLLPDVVDLKMGC